MCLVCETPRLKIIEKRAWEILDQFDPTIEVEGSYESLVRQAAKDLGVELSESDVEVIAYRVASGG